MEDNKNNILYKIIICFLAITVIILIVMMNNSGKKQDVDNKSIQNDNSSYSSNETDLKNESKEETKVEEDNNSVADTSSQYTSVFNEENDVVIDYNMTTNEDINYKKAYDLVIKESSSLKKKKDINIFRYVGKVNNIGKYYYINYDVYFYNLPKNIYEQNKEQIEKNNGYNNISKYLVKKAFYYYIFDGKTKVETKEVLNDYLITKEVPKDWLKLGKYKNNNVDCMFNDVLLMIDESHKYNDYLVVYDTGNEVKIKYKGKSKTIINSKDYKDKIAELYDRKLSYDYSEYTKYYCFADMCSSKEIDLKSYYEQEKDTNPEVKKKIVDNYTYADTVFEIVDGILHVKRVGYDDTYNLSNIKSLKVAFNVAVGYDVYLLDNNKTLHYTSFSTEYETKNGIFDKYNDYKNGIVSENVKNYAVYNSCNCYTCAFELDYNKIN